MKTSLLSKTSNWFVPLIILFALGGLLRLLDITDEPLDFQPSRQLRNSLVAREIYYSALPSATNEQRELSSLFVEYVGKYEPPVIETIVGYSYFLTGGENIAIARIWMIIFWLIAGVALFDLMRRVVSPWSALIALAFYFVLPFSVQASRSFQPDPLMTSAFVIGIYFLYRWSEENSPLLSGEGLGVRSTWKFAILASVFLGFATFVKIVIAFFVGAAAIALVIFTLGKSFWKSKQVWVMAVIMILPALLYYVFLNQGRSTEYFFSWTVALITLITSTDFYTKWLAFLGILFGQTILFLSLAGALIASPRMRWLLISLWIGYLLYGLTLPFQMYTHSYYHIQLIPIIALGLAVTLNPLVEFVANQNNVTRAGFIALVVAIIGYQAYVARSVLFAESFRHEPAFWNSVGEAIPSDAKVIALTQDYGFRLMMYGWRRVELFPLATELSETRNPDKNNAEKFDELTEGMDYFLVTAFGQLEKQPELKKILDTYPIAIEGDGFVLYDFKKIIMSLRAVGRVVAKQHIETTGKAISCFFMTLVSIITPSYNQAKYLEQTIQSVLSQDYSNIQYIVIDGASTDGSADIIKKYAEKLAYWISEKDNGQADAINKGFAKAKGEVIAWLNSDDYYLPNTISQVIKTFEENPDVVLIYGNMLAVDEKGKTFNTLNYKQLTLEDLICFQIIGQPAVFFRSSVLQKTNGLNRNFHFLLDHLFWIQLAQYGKILYVNQTWSAARYHEDAKNRAKAAEFGQEAFRILEFIKQDERLVPIFEKVKRRAIASAHRVDARYLLDGGLPAKALSAWFQALMIHPPTALARMNIFVSSILNILGLRKLREMILKRRSDSHL